MTTRALRGSLRWRSLRLCSRAPEMTISPALWGTCSRLASGPGVNVVQQVVGVLEAEVLLQIARCLLARRARQGHVPRGQAGALGGRGGWVGRGGGGGVWAVALRVVLG